MSLQHILDTIEMKGKQEADAVLKAADIESAKILEESQKKASRSKQEAQKNLQKKAADTILKAEQQAAAGIRNKILAAKRERTNRIFTEAYDVLLNNPARMEELCKKLIALLPKEDGATVKSGEKTEALIKQNTSLPVEPALKEEGFTYIGKHVEVDNRLKTLIESVRDETESDVARILFHYV